MDFVRAANSELDRARSLFGVGQESLSHDSPKAHSQLSVDNFWRELCIAAAISKNEKQSLIGITFVSTVLLFSIPVLIGILPLSFLAVFPFLILRLKLESRASSRAHEFEKDYAAFLLGLASSVRTGLDPLQAMSQSSELFDPKSEVGKALINFGQDIERGISEDDAIRAFAADIRHPDISMFRAGFILSRKEGSSLADCLLRLAKVTRQRQSFRRKMKSSVAMQRMSGFGIAGCSVLICSIQALGNPTSFLEAFHDPVGVKLMSLGILLMCAGTFWMLRMTRTRM